MYQFWLVLNNYLQNLFWEKGFIFIQRTARNKFKINLWNGRVWKNIKTLLVS